MRRTPVLTAVVATALAVGTALPASATVDPVDTTKLRDAVTVSGILAHERALQRIATENGGTRASGTPGFAASAGYVKRTLKAAGYTVKQQAFEFPFFRELAPAVLEQVEPEAVEYETATYDYSGTGDVTGEVVPVTNNVLPPTPAPSSVAGCAPRDFVPASATEPQVALIQRGGCDFRVKGENAVAAGYDAVIIFNEGQPGRSELFAGTLAAESPVPVVGLSFSDGAALAAQTEAGPVTVHVVTSTENIPGAKTWNVIAETPGGDADQVIAVGAHLDSVADGPGINDNGSGSATLLEVAEQISALKLVPRQKIRFLFFGAEESGLLGSEHYVGALNQRQLAKIYANLNFDMLGSPNYVRFVYDGDGDAAGVEGPPGSGEIERIFTDYYADQGLKTEPTAFDGRSDYGPFIEAGIPAGGLFSGAEGVKTDKQAATYGGTAGEPYDECYHAACDTVNNLNTKALFELGDGAAHAIWTLAATEHGLYEDGSRQARSTAASAATGGATHRGHAAVS